MSALPLTTHEAAERLRCHEKTVRRMIQRGEIEADLVAGRYLIAEDALPLGRQRPVSVPPPKPRAPRGRFASMVEEDAA